MRHFSARPFLAFVMITAMHLLLLTVMNCANDGEEDCAECTDDDQWTRQRRMVATMTTTTTGSGWARQRDHCCACVHVGKGARCLLRTATENPRHECTCCGPHGPAMASVRAREGVPTGPEIGVVSAMWWPVDVTRLMRKIQLENEVAWRVR